MRQKTSFSAFIENLGRRGERLPEQTQIMDVEHSMQRRAQIEETLSHARRSGNGRVVASLLRDELAAEARAFFSAETLGFPLCFFCNFEEMGGLKIPAPWLAIALPVLLDVDGDTVFGSWASTLFVFDFTSDAGARGYEAFYLTSPEWK
jgi:hypothetical protein